MKNFRNCKWVFTKSLASEQSRDITFAAPVPWFQIQTLNLTPTLALTNRVAWIKVSMLNFLRKAFFPLADLFADQMTFSFFEIECN